MTNRERTLRQLAVGDIFHARSTNGASLVCLVTGIDEGAIHARRIHTQDNHRFDRNTGFECGKDHTKIDCVAPFSPDIRNIFLELDRKYQAHMATEREGIELDPEQCRLTADEKRANLSINSHVAANPI
jgi:hypothetical protein